MRTHEKLLITQKMEDLFRVPTTVIANPKENYTAYALTLHQPQHKLLTAKCRDSYFLFIVSEIFF